MIMQKGQGAYIYIVTGFCDLLHYFGRQLHPFHPHLGILLPVRSALGCGH